MRTSEVPDWLRSQQQTARVAARDAQHPAAAAALRGKASAYAEAENVLRQALDLDAPAPQDDHHCRHFNALQNHDCSCPIGHDHYEKDLL